MAIKIVKTLKFDTNNNEEYQINAAQTQGKLRVGSKEFNGSQDVEISVTDIATETWIFNCGTSTTVLEEV